MGLGWTGGLAGWFACAGGAVAVTGAAAVVAQQTEELAV